ncbi:hypothetical protein Fmac_012633 [Flemingia macrophylla]|uniref:Small ribosomal subunit protein uS15c n=1 Tax=Flemingia macrophylla TaxID=520843 RepID=A0ABD1MQV3_9FABA
MALLLHLRTKSRIRNRPSLNLLFSTNSNSDSPFSSLFKDIKDNLKQPQPSNPRFSLRTPPTHEIQRNLAELRSRTAAPPPSDTPQQQQQQISFQELYKNRQQNPPQSPPSVNMDAIFESLRSVKAKTPTKPRLIGGNAALPESVFGREMRRDTSASSTTTAFLKTYGVEDLGKKLRILRPEGNSKDWFSVRELSERLERLRKMEEEQTRSGTRDAVADSGIYDALRGCLAEMDQDKVDNKKKASLQGLSILSHFGGTPIYSLEPPKPHLVEKYFHPDNMSSAEKLKIELAKVRDEFKMSESDCGSARVQIAQLTTKIKHLSGVLHKKDVHSRKGLIAMVQRRKRLLKYLRRTDWDSYCFVISKLGLRDNPDHTYRARSGTAA